MAIEYKTLEQLLEERGLSMDALKDPGQRFGYGSGGEYGQFFSPFDIEGYQAGKQRTGLQSELQKIQQAGKPSGLTGGAQDRLMSMARQAGSESYGDLARQTSQKRTATQEQLGSQYGALQGMFTSFLGDSTTRALQITQADPTGGNQGRLVTAQDIESFNSRLGMGDRMSFNAAAQGLIGQDYQQLIDLYGDYAQNG